MMLLAAQTLQNEIQTPAFLGESWGFWCQFLVIASTAGLALFTLIKNERRARLRATIDLVLLENQDARFRDVKEQYALMRENNVDFTLLVCDPSEDECRRKEIADQKETLIAILNQYEFIAAAIFTDSLDERLYKKMKRGVVIRDWEALSGFVMELRKRERKAQIFCEMENLVQKWQNEKPKRLKVFK